MARPPIDVLFVASWYPSFDDPVAGRFVADQADALAATGRVRPAVVSFEPAGLIGAGGLRDRVAATVGRLAAAAVGNEEILFAPRGGDGRPDIPVARLTIPHGRHPSAGPAAAALARDGVLAALAARLVSAPSASDPPSPAIVHAQTGYPDGAASTTLADRLGRPLVITEHASFVDRLLAEPAIRSRYVAAATRSARLVVVSRTLATELAAALPELAPKIAVVPNAVALDAFGPAGGAAERIPDELLYVGYRKDSKGIGTLLEAFARVHRQRPGATLRLVGSSPTTEIEEGWRRQAGRLGILDAVRFDPPEDRRGVAAAMARAALFVHPSPRETFGVVAVEALASGLPVVAADSGGVSEILGADPAALGAIVPPHDPAALAEAIVRTLERRSAFDPAALRFAVEDRFASAVVAGRLAELYDAILDEVGTPAATAPGAPRPAPAHAVAEARAATRVIVAFDPDRAALVARLPAAVRAGIVLVTSAETEAPAGLAAVVTADLRGRARAVADAALLGPPSDGARRILRALRHPLAVARRRGLLPGLEGLVTSRGADAVREGVGRARREAGNRAAVPILVCVDGLDHLAAAAAVAAGEATLAAGGLRHLADLAASAGIDAA